MKSESPKVKTTSASQSAKERIETKTRSKTSATIRRVRTPAIAPAGVRSPSIGRLRLW